MKINYPKLGNMTHSLSFEIFTTFKGINFYILLPSNLPVNAKT